MANITLIESDHIMASNLKQVLARRGHNLDWQIDLQAAMDSIDKKSPDLVILDLLLAARSGLEFLYEFRSYPEWQEIPIIIFSHIPPEDFDEFNEGFAQLQIKAYHYKPTTSLDELSRSVESVLQTAAV